jgi:Spy/CpxP family protein refolding chaperone
MSGFSRTASGHQEDSMSMSKRIVLGLSAAAITVALAGVGFATGQADSAQNPAGGRGGPGRFGGPGFGRGGPGGRGGAMGVLGPMMIERLDLTADQKDRVKQIVDSHRADQQAIGQRMMAAHNALDTAITSASFDEALVRTRAADVAAVEADETVLRARIYAEVLQILTADQQAKLKTMQADMQQRRGQRGQKH